MKYNKKANYMTCPKCKGGGDVYADATGTLEVPTGFGFLPNDTKFSVETIKMKGHFGECMDCGKRIFNWTSRKAGRRYPKSINNKLNKARKNG